MTVNTSNRRTPPASTEAERAILGAVLIDETGEALAKSAEILSGPADFYNPGRRMIYESMTTVFERGEPVDLMTLCEELKRRGWLDKVGGVEKVAELMDATPTAANVSAHCRIVWEKAALRRILTAAGEIIASVHEGGECFDELVDGVEKTFFGATQTRIRKEAERIGDALKGGLKYIEKLYETKSGITGAATGYKDLDIKTAGLQKSDLIIIAGRPSMGKTAFALNIVQNMTCENPDAVALVFSLEMSVEQLSLRMLCSEAGVNASRMRTGYLARSDWPLLTSAAGRLYGRNIYIDDTAGATALELHAKARRIAAKLGRLDMIVIDYLQLMDVSGRSDSRVQEITQITRSLKKMAKEFDVPVVALSQLSRAVEMRGGDMRPRLSDLRESGSIEQDADVVLFIFREEFYKPEKPDAQGVAEVIIGKQRNGPLGTVALTFIKETMTFKDMARIHG